MKFTTFFVVIATFWCANSFAADDVKKVIRIGTGNKSALAYPVLSSMCEVFNRKTPDKNLSCQAFETGGAEDNLDGIVSGKYDAGVIKADMEYNAYNGLGVYYGKAYRDLRTIFGLHHEYLTIIVKKDSNINGIKDIEGKRIYIGNKGSGSRLIVDKFFDGIGMKHSKFKKIYEETPDKIHDLFCEDKIDAAVYLVGHPNDIFMRTMEECGVRMIGFSKQELQNYATYFRYFAPALIKKKTYANQSRDIHTFASQLMLASSEKIDADMIYTFSQVIAKNYQEIQKKSPALAGAVLFSPEVKIIPMHSGVIRYYRNN